MRGQERKARYPETRARSIVKMIKAQIKATGKITAALSVMVERAYAQAIKAKAQGTRTVAPKATY